MDRSVTRSCGWRTRRIGWQHTLPASPVPIGESADLEMAEAGRIRWIFPASGRRNVNERQLRKVRRLHRILRLWVSPISRKRRRGSRRSRIPPRRAHDTLQLQDESIIVGYYTSAEVHPQKLPASQPSLWGEKGVLWQEATVFIVPAQET